MTRFHSPDSGPQPERQYAARVVLDGRLGERCATLLAEAGVSVTTETVIGSVTPALQPGVVTVLATDRPRPRLASRLDAHAWHARLPWTSGTMIAHEFRIGPSVIPGVTPCFDCWSRRVRSLVPDLAAHDAVDALARSDSVEPWFRGRLAPQVDQVAALLAAEALALAERVAAPPIEREIFGLVWEGDAVAGALRARRFSRVRVCARCSADEESGRADSLTHYFAQCPLGSRVRLAV